MTKSEPARFTAMRDGTREEFQAIHRHGIDFFRGLPDRVLSHLELLALDTGGYAVDRLTHSLQTATRAQRDGRDEEYVVCALIHDIGDSLAPINHSELAAAILAPFVGEKNLWTVRHHEIFQGYYFFHHLGHDRDMRDRFREHEYFRDCAEFCEKYDQNSFDPTYDTLPLEAFEPALRRVLAEPRSAALAPEQPGAA